VSDWGSYATPWLIEDVDDDGVDEVLFWHGTVNALPAAEHGLYLYGASGELRWHATPGRSITIAGAPYDDTYSVQRVATGKYGQGETFIAMAAAHRPDAIPTQVTILDVSGEKLGEYWHFGQVHDMYAVDADGDGIDEIVLGGSNSAITDPDAAREGGARQQAFVALIEHDINDAIGPGVTAPDAGLRSGLERAYLALPFSSEADASGAGNTVWDLRPSPGGFHADVGITDAQYHLARLYTFNHRFELVRLVIKPGYFSKHRSLRSEGRISHTLAEEYLRQQHIERLVWRLGDPPGLHVIGLSRAR
jgi:hypothetical protein